MDRARRGAERPNSCIMVSMWLDRFAFMLLTVCLNTISGLQVSNYSQCGGNAYYCSTLVPANCVDKQWEKSYCATDFTCSRHNASW